MTDLEKFENRIQKELEELNYEQIIEFACVCAIKSIPFIGINPYKIWRKDTNKHLYNVFYAIDASLRYKTNLPINKTNIEGSNNINRINFFTHSLTNNLDLIKNNAVSKNALNTSYFKKNEVTNNALIAAFSSQKSIVANTAFVAAYASAAVYAAINNNIIATDFISKVIIHVQKVAFSSNNLKLIESLIEDLLRIKNNQPLKIINPKEFYGKIWLSFINTLNNEKCGYWGRVYEKIFEAGFEINIEDIERRLNVPESIKAEGAVTVAKYLENLEKEGGELLNEARIIILGEKGAGKTCLARRLINPEAPMTTIEESTPGVDTTIWQSINENLNIRVWDFAGHTVTHAVHRFFLSERCLYIMVYDGRTEERNRIEYWLDHIKNYGGDSKVIILVNKKDNHRNNIPINELKDRYSIDTLFEFSIQDDKEKLDDFRSYVLDYIKNNPAWNKQEIPKNYYKVKEELEKLFIKGSSECCTEKIEKKQYEEIAERFGIEDKDQLLENLHSLGISLWYKDIEGIDTLILNPEWISQGVYKVINWLNNQNKYSISLEDLKEVFAGEESRYPTEELNFIYKLLLKYELAYEAKKGGILIVPQLLQEDRPKILPDFTVGESLMLRYKAVQPLPPDTISRFIVRHNQEIKKEKGKDIVWRKGIVLKDGGNTIALVREVDRVINVSVKGDNKTEYISKLRDSINEIFNSYKSQNPELEYRVELYGLVSHERNELWLTENKVLGHINQNEPYFDDQTGKKIYLNEIVSIYNIQIHGNVFIGSSGITLIDNSVTNNFNFHNCTIGLQGNLNDLSQLLQEKENIEEAEELTNTASLLEKVEQCKTPEEVKKTGILSRISRMMNEFNDENSSFHSAIKKVKNGISIAQDIAKTYNDIAQWAGLPQVPTPFLKKT